MMVIINILLYKVKVNPFNHVMNLNIKSTMEVIGSWSKGNRRYSELLSLMYPGSECHLEIISLSSLVKAVNYVINSLVTKNRMHLSHDLVDALIVIIINNSSVMVSCKHENALHMAKIAQSSRIFTYVYLSLLF